MCQSISQKNRTLAEKHDFKIGKWLARAAEPDEIWIKLVMDFAYDKFPPGTIALKISPVNDVETPGDYSF